MPTHKLDNKQSLGNEQHHRDIARKLNEARSSLKISIENAARNTKINKNLLNSFESGRFDINDTYTSALLISYAKYLELDHKALLGIEQSSQPVIMNRSYRRVRAFVASNSISTTVLIGTVTIALGAAIWLVLAYFAAPKLVVYSPDADVVVEAYSVVVIGETSSGSDVFINNEPVLVDLEGGFEHRVLLAEGLNELQIKAVNSLSREAIEERVIVANFPDVANQ